MPSTKVWMSRSGCGPVIVAPRSLWVEFVELVAGLPPLMVINGGPLVSPTGDVAGAPEAPPAFGAPAAAEGGTPARNFLLPFSNLGLARSIERSRP
jgi:hypothetical protein